MITSVELFESSWYVWLLALIAFTAAFSLVVAGSTLFIYLISERGPEFLGSQRQRSILALVVFCLVIAVPAYLLVVLTTDRTE